MSRLLTPAERLCAENRALEFIRSKRKADGEGIAYTVREFVAQAQLDKAEPLVAEELFEEIENIIDIGLAYSRVWQALKAKWVKK